MSIRLDESEQHQLVYAVFEESKRIGMPPETMLKLATLTSPLAR
ncbi:hypothetical protein [Roseibium sp.]|nr:hypothetical protein [Roseibium sp.]